MGNFLSFITCRKILWTDRQKNFNHLYDNNNFKDKNEVYKMKMDVHLDAVIIKGFLKVQDEFE